MFQFTVITICLNAEENINDTIRSVLGQTCTDFEYIIKDGLSKDKTVEIAQSYNSAFLERGISYRIISQADQGIYDAMNQAVQEAQGEWVLYMNAGDIMANASVLEQVKESSCMDEADVMYGDVILKSKDLFLFQKAQNLDEIRFGMPFCHQSTFTRRALFEQNMYSLEYRICSDYDFYLQQYQKGKIFHYIPITISIFDMSGASSNWKQSVMEKIRIVEKNPVRDEAAIQYLDDCLKKEYHKAFMHRILWRYVPKKMRMKRKFQQKRKMGWKTAEEMFGSGKAES